MADNVQITPGSGNVVAADEVTDGTLGTVKVQYVKLMDGTIDGVTKGVIGANGLHVDGSAVTQPVSATSLPLPTGASTSANQSTANSSLATIATNTTNAGTPAVTGTVTANAGTNLNTSALALDTSVKALEVTQGSTTSGQSGILTLGAVTSGNPSYSSTQTAALSLNTTGSLRVTATISQTIAGDNNTTGNYFQAASTPLFVANYSYGGKFNGTANAALQGFSATRTPTVFKTVQATASGNTAIWTAGTGNKWNLLAYRIEVTSNASLSAGAVLTVKFQDVTTDISISHDIFVPTTAVTTVAGDAYDSGWTVLSTFGIRAASVTTALNVNLSAALATGNVRVIVAGTEE